MQSKRAVSTHKEKYPHERVGSSKFAELCPKHCILAGASGAHSVCVCTIHQNVKLTLRGARLHELTNSDDNPVLQSPFASLLSWRMQILPWNRQAKRATTECQITTEYVFQHLKSTGSHFVKLKLKGMHNIIQ